MTDPHRAARVTSGMSERRGMEEGYRILSTILAGLLLYGGLGWLADHLLHSSIWLPMGIILGTVTSLYVVIMRQRRLEEDTTSMPSTTTREERQ